MSGMTSWRNGEKGAEKRQARNLLAVREDIDDQTAVFQHLLENTNISHARGALNSRYTRIRIIGQPQAANFIY